MRRALAALALALGAALLIPNAARATAYDDPAAYCAAVRTIDRPDPRYVGPKVPDWMARALMAAVKAPPNADPAFFRHAEWRCADGHVLACVYGANLPCGGKADTNRRPTAAMREFCAQQPGQAFIPAYVAGHATIFAWRCRGADPAIERQILAVDRRGYARRFWYRVAPN